MARGMSEERNKQRGRQLVKLPRKVSSLQLLTVVTRRDIANAARQALIVFAEARGVHIVQVGVKNVGIHLVLHSIHALEGRSLLKLHLQAATEGSAVQEESVVLIHVTRKEGAVMSTPDAIALRATKREERGRRLA